MHRADETICFMIHKTWWKKKQLITCNESVASLPPISTEAVHCRYTIHCIDNPFKLKASRWISKLLQVYNNFKRDDNSIKFYNRVENTVGKGEIIVTSNFFVSHNVFKRLVNCRHVKTWACLVKSYTVKI